MEQQVITRSNDCMFHLTELIFHLWKIINSSLKQWKDELTSAKFSVIYVILSLKLSAQIIHKKSTERWNGKN